MALRTVPDLELAVIRVDYTPPPVTGEPSSVEFVVGLVVAVAVVVGLWLYGALAGEGLLARVRRRRGRDEVGGIGLWIALAFLALGLLRWLFGSGVLRG